MATSRQLFLSYLRAMKQVYNITVHSNAMRWQLK